MKKPALRYQILTCGLAALCFFFLCFCSPGEQSRRPEAAADLIIFNGPIYTVDDAFPRVEAIAVKGDLLIAAGERADILSLRSPETRFLDLKGRTLIPGIIDAHIHFITMGQVLEQVDLFNVRSYQELIEAVRIKAGKTPRGKWIEGRGWDQNKWPDKAFPDHRALSAAIPDHPVILRRVDGHAALINTRAMEICQISKNTPDPPGGKIHRMPGSPEPTGILIDNAVSLVDQYRPEPDERDYRRYIKAGTLRCLSAGLTTVHDPGEKEKPIRVLKKMFGENQIPIRVYVMLEGTAEVVNAYLSTGPEIGLFDRHLTIRCIKLYADGALGSRGAALLSPYLDDPGNTGIVITDEESLYAFSKRAAEKGFQVAVHAIGDRANRMVLNAFSRVLEDIKPSDFRPRIEHAQVLAAEDVPRFKKLGVIASMQPIHCISDMAWAVERLGPAREKNAYTWRSLLDRGVDIAYGTDAPVESENPMHGFYAAVTRRDLTGRPPGGWHPEQCMSRLEALQAMTIHAARAGFEEEIKGSLTPGKLADMVVLSEDIMTIQVDKIPGIQVIATIVGGRVVYKNPAFSGIDIE
jgi:predicted amidohydrolase YtcJ